MRTYIIAYFSTAISYLVLDFIWLSLSSGPIYKARLGSLLLEKPNLGVALAFYLLFSIAIVIFAVLPALSTNDWVQALWSGALLGFSAYGAYDLTNQATLVGWSWFVSIADMAWGTFVVGAASAIGFFITKLVAKTG